MALLDFQIYLRGQAAGLLDFVYPPVNGISPTDPATAPTPPTVYTGPIGWALANAGMPPANPFALAETDLTKAVTAGKFYLVADLAEYRLLANTLGSYVEPDETALDLSQSWGALRGQFAARVSELSKQLAPLLASGKYKVGRGTYRLPIQDRGWGGEWGV